MDKDLNNSGSLCFLASTLFVHPNFKVSLISLTIVLHHQMINSDTEATGSLEMMNGSVEHIYKAVCPDKKNNSFSILETVLMTLFIKCGHWFLWTLKCHITTLGTPGEVVHVGPLPRVFSY